MSLDLQLPVATPAALAPSGHMPVIQTAPPAWRNMDLKNATYMLRRRGRLILGVAGAALLGGLILSMLLTPMYKAIALVMLEPRHTEIVNIQQVLSPLAATSEALRSEIEIIKSRAVIDRVIDRLKLTDDPEFNPPLPVWSPSRWARVNAADAEVKAALRTRVAVALKDRLNVSNDGKSFVIQIAALSHDPRKAARIANAFADSYLTDQMQAKFDAVARANSWLNGQMGDLKIKVEDAEQAVEEYRAGHNLVEVDDGQTVAAKQMNDINDQLGVARGEVGQAEAKLRTLHLMLKAPGGIDSAGDVLASPLIQNLREQEMEMKRNQADLASRYGPLHPRMINAQAQYRELENKIAEETHRIALGLAGQVEIARSKERQLAAQLNALEKHAGAEKRQDVTLRQLQREADANRALYESFLNRFKQVSQQSDMQTPDARIIAHADTPIAPAFPKKLVFMSVGLMLGGILGVIVAYLVEYFDRGFRNAAQLEEYSGIPVIGIVPDVRSLTGRTPEDYVADKPMSSFGEALRTVRTAIHFSNVDQPPKTIMVTSSIPGEGKTTFCLSLARTLARTGNRVLVIDADMRRSRIANALGFKKKSGGLAAVLAGEATVAQSLTKDPLIDHLDYILAVNKTPNAQDLLGSRQMQLLIEEVSVLYDLVIIDTPPILAVADAAMVARVADASLFLVHWARTPRDQALQAIKQLTQLKCRLAGVVLSQVDLAEQAKYTDSYYHRNYAEYYVD